MDDEEKIYEKVSSAFNFFPFFILLPHPSTSFILLPLSPSLPPPSSSFLLLPPPYSSFLLIPGIWLFTLGFGKPPDMGRE
jgi:hypothetical protein